ncbi:30S ribosomal protein S3ae [Ignicoccus hospitalis]|uniref:Small ribosomal subunit protein eS1 n=1 Tax=Ignicoccus hospitalis (strain KIN4/I / DSM 18386 / JCM 14125) TaxID=453591 RepID=RS3A_IGNH4|nr:30S ribosomal protein S3ae [Ignicoccus hospitalis]A8AAU3.1 RecName: Full=Small ribosomal subunit protein eS1; AltName: Full=30S ribosomal protein S3Ae; AltName: Full=Ribosomal protein S1e [Ignicoccus hospitalis KIN4/I]ABU82045.1 SSU ribosomal protein S3AE [Ignicoccus hospitalis KIN4/I]HIH91002.1 30S ribosomal protein S3ae [Desulfurococcaceae archaeon]
MSARRRGALKDKWKIKKWYEIITPDVFNNVSVGQTPADEAWKLIGRTVDTTLYDITGDFTYVHVHVYLQINKVDEEALKAYTIFKGHELARDYIRSLTRRKSSKIEGIFDVWTKDGYGLRITVDTFTAYRCQTSQKRAIRKIQKEVIEEMVPQMTLDEVINAMLFGDIAEEISNRARKIYPIRRTEIYKSKVLYMPSPEGPIKAVIVPKPPA